MIKKNIQNLKRKFFSHYLQINSFFFLQITDADYPYLYTHIRYINVTLYLGLVRIYLEAIDEKKMNLMKKK